MKRLGLISTYAVLRENRGLALSIRQLQSTKFNSQEKAMKTKNVNKGSRGFAVTAEKYEPIRKAILASIPRSQDGMSFKELVAAVKGRVSEELFPKRGSVAWYTKVVQLDLEAKGQIERIPGVKPQRVRRVR